MGDKPADTHLRETVRPWWPRALVAGTLILFIAGIWYLVRQMPRDPVYHGKPLTVWLRTYAPHSSSGLHSREWNEADEAVHHLGTNCIPTLLRLIGHKDSKLKLRLIALAQNQRLIKIHFVPAEEQNVEASRAFIALGDMGRDAVPALVCIYNEGITTESQCAIEDAFSWIGPAAKPAVPLLLHAATNANPRVRANALWALGEIHAEPQLCVPLLVRGLSDSDQWTELSAAHALGMFGPNAKSAVPSLSELTNASVMLKRSPASMGLQVMLEALKALRKIEPPIASPANDTYSDFGVSTPNARRSVRP